MMKRRIVCLAALVMACFSSAVAEPTGFTYIDNGDNTITLTGVTGSAPKGAFLIPATYDDKAVTGVGEKFMAKTSGVTALVIDEGVRYLGAEAFHDIPTLTGVSLPSTLTNVNEKAFADCPKLAKITVSGYNEDVNVVNNVLCDFGTDTAVVGLNGITTLALPVGITRIGAQAFCACTKMKTADLMTSDLVALGKNAFAGCTSLTDVYFPPSFAAAGEEPFLACSRLKEVYFFGAEPTVDESFYWLAEDDPASVSKTVTTVVREGKGWTDVPGEWKGRPIVYGDPYLVASFCAGSEGLGTLSGGNRAVKAGTTVKLTAKPSYKDYVFAGWFYDKSGTTNSTAVGLNDYRAPTFQYVVEHDTWLYAKFIPKEADRDVLVWCEFDPAGYAAGEYMSVPVLVYSQSLPTVTVSSLPAGLKFDAATMTISGVPTKAGDFRFTIKVKNASGATASKSCVAKVNDFLLALLPAFDGDTHELPTAGCRLTGAGRYVANRTVKLSATAPKGYVFTGWTDEDGAPLDNGTQDFRTASGYAYAMGTNDVILVAHFMAIQEDFCDNITVEDESLVPQGRISVESKSLPTYSATGLPRGLTFDKATHALVVDETKLKSGDYAFVLSAKNAAGYKVDRVVTFQYDSPQLYEDWANEFVLGEIVLEDLTPALEEPMEIISLTVKTPPAGLKVVCVDGTYYLAGLPTKPGRYTVRCSFRGYVGEHPALVTVDKTYYMTVSGAPSRYVEITTDGTPGCTVTGSGVYAAGATVKTSAKAARGYVFACWCEGTNEYWNVYADYLDKDGDPRIAAQTWLCGSCALEDFETFPTLPIVDGKNYARLTGAFVESDEDALDGIRIFSEEDGTEVDSEWNVKIEDGEHTSYEAATYGIYVGVDSVSAPKLTIKGSISGLTIRNYGTYAELYYDASGTKMPKPGEYTLTFTAVNQSKDAATRTLTVRVPNKLAMTDDGMDLMNNLDTSAEGLFILTAGERMEEIVDPQQLFLDNFLTDEATLAAEGITVTKLTVSGLPAGVSCRDGIFSGVPTKPGCYTLTFTVTYRQDGRTRTTTATAYFRVEAIDATVVGTFNGGIWDDATNALGTVSVTLSSVGKVTSCKIVDLLSRTETIAFTDQSFYNGDGYCEVSAMGRDGMDYWFIFYPAPEPAEGETRVELGGVLEVARSDYTVAMAYQNVWSDTTYKTLGLLPAFPSRGLAVPYLPDALKLVFKPAGVVSATMGKKTTANRFELASLTFDAEGAWTGWLGYVTVNVPNGSLEGYCRTFEVEVSADSSEITVTPVD